MKRKASPKRTIKYGFIITPVLLIGLMAFSSYKQFREASTRVTIRSDRCVVLIHGLLRTPEVMEPLEKFFLRDNYSVINFSYDSIKADINDITSQLDRTLTTGPAANCRSFDFAAHSMGVSVGRRYLSNNKLRGMGRFVMIAPPGRGSKWGNFIARWVPGASRFIGRALGVINSPVTGSSTAYEFGIIAGGTGTPFGLNPFIPGDDDMTVGVEETKIDGMRDFVIIRGQHTLLLKNEATARLTRNFFTTGSFTP